MAVRNPGLGDAAGVPALSEETRLMTKVARLYHEQGIRQPEIAGRLNISQPRMSRLLKKAVETGIARTTVVAPRASLRRARGRARAAVRPRRGRRRGHRRRGGRARPHPCPRRRRRVLPRDHPAGRRAHRRLVVELGAARHGRLDASAPQPRVRVGRPGPRGLGQPSAQARATHLVGRLVQVTGAQTTYLPAPGLVATADTRTALMHEASISEALTAYPDLTVLLAGIGSLRASPLLRASGNAVGDDDEEQLRRSGAVGDVCMRFFDEAGAPVRSHLDDRILGIDAPTLPDIPRRIGVAGGARKHGAIRAALLGGWINVLVTDSATAEYLRSAPGA